MPIWLRKYTYSEIDKFYQKEKSDSENQTTKGQTNMVNPDGSINAPAFARESKQYQGKSSYK